MRLTVSFTITGVPADDTGVDGVVVTSGMPGV